MNLVFRVEGFSKDQFFLGFGGEGCNFLISDIGDLKL